MLLLGQTDYETTVHNLKVVSKSLLYKLENNSDVLTEDYSKVEPYVDQLLLYILIDTLLYHQLFFSLRSEVLRSKDLLIFLGEVHTKEELQKKLLTIL